MINIRQGLFETNSSSVHTLTIVSESEYDAWVKGELVFSTYTDTLIPKAEAIAECGENPSDESLAREGYYTIQRYDEDLCEFLDTYMEIYTSKSGDKIIAFGYYGYN